MPNPPKRPQTSAPSTTSVGGSPVSPRQSALTQTARPSIPPHTTTAPKPTRSIAVTPEFIERYQIELEKNPKSRVFAPLAEAYRKMGLVAEAIRICKVGLSGNPDFAGGFVAYAKALIETGAFNEALPQLKKATTLSTDNLLAHTLMGEVLLELRKPKDALKAFKMVLFLNPDDEKAKATVRKWEFLSADEFDDEEFAMRPVFGRDKSEIGAQRAHPPIESELSLQSPLDKTLIHRRAKEIDRAVSLADAFTVRNDLAAAMETLERATRILGKTPEIENRLKMLARRTQTTPVEQPETTLEPTRQPTGATTPVQAQAGNPQSLQKRIEDALRSGTSVGTRVRFNARVLEQKIILLEGLLHRISERRLAV